MSDKQMPPWLKDKLLMLQKIQQNLQSIMAQKQHLELENIESEKAIEELKKITDDNTVFKNTGIALIKSTKQDLINELEEKQLLTKTRIDVIEKQEVRLKEDFKNQEAKITTMMKGGTDNNSNPSIEADNPRK